MRESDGEEMSFTNWNAVELLIAVFLFGLFVGWLWQHVVFGARLTNLENLSRKFVIAYNKNIDTGDRNFENHQKNIRALILRVDVLMNVAKLKGKITEVKK